MSTERVDVSDVLNPEVIAGCSFEAKIDPTDALYAVITIRAPRLPPPLNADAMKADGMNAVRAQVRFALAAILMPLAAYDQSLANEVSAAFAEILDEAPMLTVVIRTEEQGS